MASWLRLWHDMPTDPKWRVIAKRSGQSIGNVIAVFNMMLVCASVADDRGTLQNWNDEDAAAALDLEESDIAAIRTAMQGKVIEGDQLTGWQKRQPEREDYSTPRVRRYREEHKQDETQCNADETQGNNTEKNRTEQIQNITEKEHKEPAFFSPEHKATEQLKIISAEFNLDLEREIDRRPRAPDIVELVRIAREVFPIMIGAFTGFEAARHSLKWLRQSSWHSTKGFDRLEWLLDVRNRGQKAAANLRQYSGKEGDYARKMAALEAEYAVNGS